MSLEEERDHVRANMKSNSYSKHENFKKMLGTYLEELSEKIRHVHSAQYTPNPPRRKPIFAKWNQLTRTSDRITFSVMDFLDVRDLVSLVATSHRKRPCLSFTADGRAIELMVETSYPAVSLTAAFSTYTYKSLPSLVWVYGQSLLPGGDRARAPPVNAQILCELCKAIEPAAISLQRVGAWYLQHQKFSDVCYTSHLARSSRSGSGSRNGHDVVATETIFTLCARYGNHTMLNDLLSMARSEEDMIACANVLQHACDRNQLSPFGYTPNAIFSVQGFTAMHFACLAGHADVVQVLMNNGCQWVSVLTHVHDEGDEPAFSDAPSPLMMACLGGHLPVVRLLLSSLQQRQTPEVQEQELHYSTDSRGLSALQYAVIGVTVFDKVVTALSQPTSRADRVNVIRDLLSADQSIMRKITRMQFDDRHDQAMINQKAWHNHQDRLGNTALHIACENNEVDIVRELLPAMDPTSILSIVNQEKRNALETAKHHKHEHILHEMTRHINAAAMHAVNEPRTSVQQRDSNSIHNKRYSSSTGATYHHHVKTEKW